MKEFKTAISVGILSALPVLSFAQLSGIQGLRPISGERISLEGIVGILGQIINWLFTFLLIAAVIFIFVAAFKYLTAEGDESKVQSAHSMIIYAAVAIAVGFLAQGVVFIVKTLVGG